MSTLTVVAILAYLIGCYLVGYGINKEYKDRSGSSEGFWRTETIAYIVTWPLQYLFYLWSRRPWRK